ncbi:MAG: TonB family protein [candidate division KSB1 bacterium]|nr:TonB family protein [candidate division KSB1 bacterium]MDZ7333523.1 TonB family protein [candidate division KSB1 bacterium]MDZ7356727.1 TonB family protein [candidate division KSB1 bacterium]MDZ7375687.1 TonB family protein [candidate division KSB1 bacterium]MDZ7398637.1 TonB family protein [candidate division KSB1 bacterium]
MANSYKQLVLNVVQPGKAQQFIVRPNRAFTIGQHGDNDLILFGQNYPKRHILIYQKNGAYLVNIRPFIDGRISTNESTLHIKDLLQHDIIPRNGQDVVLKLNPMNRGFFTVGDARIEFEFRTVDVKAPVVFDTSAFSWKKAVMRGLFSDLMFKAIFLVLLLINSLIVYAFKDYVVTTQDKFDIEKMPERLAKFIVKPPELKADLSSKILSTTGTSAGEQGQKSDGQNRQSNQRGGNKGQGGGKGRGNPAASAGLLGLIAGTGPSGKSSSIVDALVDRGLVADLNKIVGGGTNLKVSSGGNTKDAIDPLDQLIGTGGSGGIDNFLSALEEDVPQVELKKQAKVDLVKPSKITGSKEAMGHRTEESIWNVVNARQGTIRYIYEKYLKRNPNLRGKITIEFTIAANGFVTEAKIIESTIDNPEFEQELLSIIRRLKFEPIPTGNVTTVFPFVFSKIN